MYVLVMFCCHMKTIYLYISLLFLLVFLDKFNSYGIRVQYDISVNFIGASLNNYIYIIYLLLHIEQSIHGSVVLHNAFV